MPEAQAALAAAQTAKFGAAPARPAPPPTAKRAAAEPRAGGARKRPRSKAPEAPPGYDAAEYAAVFEVAKATLPVLVTTARRSASSSTQSHRVGALAAACVVAKRI
jgi:hypothetical protein